MSPAAAWAQTQVYDLKSVKRANQSRILTIFAVLLDFKDLEVCIFAMALFTFPTKCLSATFPSAPDSLKSKVAPLLTLYTRTLTTLLETLSTALFSTPLIPLLPTQALDLAFSLASSPKTSNTSSSSESEATTLTTSLTTSLRVLSLTISKITHLASQSHAALVPQRVRQIKHRPPTGIVFGEMTPDLLPVEYEYVVREVEMEVENVGYFDGGFLRLTGGMVERGRGEGVGGRVIAVREGVRRGGKGVGDMVEVLRRGLDGVGEGKEGEVEVRGE